MANLRAGEQIGDSEMQFPGLSSPPTRRIIAYSYQALSVEIACFIPTIGGILDCVTNEIRKKNPEKDTPPCNIVTNREYGQPLNLSNKHVVREKFEKQQSQ